MKDAVIGDTAATLWLFLAAVFLVLVIACANVANWCWRAEPRGRTSLPYAPPSGPGESGSCGSC